MPAALGNVTGNAGHQRIKDDAAALAGTQVFVHHDPGVELAFDGVRALVVHAGDFFGPHMANAWFSQGLIKPGRPVTSVSYPGKRGIGHQWAY